MGQFDQPFEDRLHPSEYQATGDALRLLREDLESLRQKVSQQLAREVDNLETRKQRLMGDIEALEQDFESLKRQHRELQQNHDLTLSQQQQAQQQLWAKRLAQALATHFHARLQDSLQSITASAQTSGGTVSTGHHQIAALDATVQSTLQSLQQDLTSYQSGLSQQINRMQSIEQQGEAILEALVTRLSQQLQTQMVRPAVGADPAPHRHGTVNTSYSQESRTVGTAAGGGHETTNGHSGVQLPPTASPVNTFGTLLQDFQSVTPSQPTSDAQTHGAPTAQRTVPAQHLGAYRSPNPGATQSTAESSPRNGAGPAPSGSGPAKVAQTSDGASRISSQHLYRGLALMVLSTLALSMHNVLVGIVGYGGRLLGQIPVDSIFPLNIPNSLLLLWLRMVFVLPLLMVIATRLYPPVWEDMRRLMRSPDKRPFYQVIASGGFLFLSQVLIYKAIADVGPGVAVTLLFMYPLVTVPLAWFLFGDRPTPLRLVVMFAISMGIVFTALPRIYMDLNNGTVSLWGVGAAVLASIAFALFLVAMQLSFRQLHPVPVSLLQFSTIFSLTSLILIIGSFVGLNPGEPSSSISLYMSGFMLGLLTLMGYLFNNYGVKLMGAAQASIVASSGPVMTAILAYIVTPGEKSALSFIQWMGVVLVTLGVISLSLEKLTQQKRSNRRRPPPLPTVTSEGAPNQP
jgi:drug/metabolite transporter (DMT)-like permease